MLLAKYIKYSTNYRYAYGMLKKGGEICDTLVKIGRRARHYMHTRGIRAFGTALALLVANA